MNTLINKIEGSPAPGLLELAPQGVPLASDGFRIDYADLNGAPTDSEFGGSVLNWLATPGAFLTSVGYLRQNSNNVAAIIGAGLEIGNGNVRGTMGLIQLPAGTINLDFRKPRIDVGPVYSTCYRVRVSNQGVVELLRKSQPTGQYVLISTGTHIMTCPGSFGLQIVDRTLSIIIDGRVVETWNEANTILNGNFFEIVVSSGFSIYSDYVKFESVS